MNNMRNKILMTLALLLTAVTGAWAQGTLNVVEIEVPKAWETDNSNMTTADLTGFKASTLDEAKAWKGAPAEGYVMLIYAFDGDDAYYVGFNNGEPFSDHSPFQKNDVFANSNSMKFYYTAATGPEVAWNAETKTGTFTMPGSDVVLTPIYAKAAAFATTGTEPEVKTLLPEAAEGVIADTDAPLIVEGTVAFAGQSTTVKQGTVMYAVTPATVTEAPALDAANKWSADVPTAKLVADGGVDVLVWYYIKGADTPQGQTATAENTFNDSEICAEPITVTVLSNKFDIQFKAANDNTIEDGKATVTANGEQKTVTEGKLTGVKMGSKVKVTAKEGYKFRKVEAKKGGLLSIEITGHATATIYYVEGETWEQAIQNHPTENSAWKIDQGYVSGNGVLLFKDDNFVNSNNTIDPNANYYLQLT
jgi:hypothetical protein